MDDEQLTSAENPEIAVEDDPFVVRRAKLDALRRADYDSTRTEMYGAHRVL